MELMYPIVVLLCFVLALAIFFSRSPKKKGYADGKKVANTKYIKETKYYQEKIKRYRKIVAAINILSVTSILLTSILIARPVTVQTKAGEKQSRDIILSIDVSLSQNEVNLELVKKFRKMLPNLEGDRIGIVVFNTCPLVYCPIMEDYEYIDECLATLENQIQIVIDNGGDVPFNTDDFSAQQLFYGGVITGNNEKGSSLIGDGLAGSLFSFPELKTDRERTRILVFATDNSLNGEETVTLQEACALCKEYHVYVYAYCPTQEMNSYVTNIGKSDYQQAIEKTAGGKFYTGDLSRMTSSIMDEIKQTKTSTLKASRKTYVVDHPEVFFISVVAVYGMIIILEKRIRLS